MPDRFVWLLAISVLLVLTTVAFCSDVMKPAAAHSWYSDLVSPKGQKCCGGRDCMPYEYRWSGPSVEALMPDGSWLSIPEDTFLPIPPGSEPEKIHVCCISGHCKSSNSVVRCAILGFGV